MPASRPRAPPSCPRAPPSGCRRSRPPKRSCSALGATGRRLEQRSLPQRSQRFQGRSHLADLGHHCACGNQRITRQTFAISQSGVQGRRGHLAGSVACLGEGARPTSAGAPDNSHAHHGTGDSTDCGRDHGVAVQQDGTVWAWGKNAAPVQVRGFGE
ncbi:RCC1-like domain-containing protein [Corallococcus sicarius]|uniref:RCC1 repeat-containing protein n=1 Tax=Corallococcus sicarius TaxID=2316726 RepID=A0A3A8NGE8_9BACT|nr:RCC1 domain-containing protein [Corallococcus sicarius]RKH41301.1 hypothetical protein D7X12_18585 [Corallococcus sicarius]